jgi:stringent starvation protein B
MSTPTRPLPPKKDVALALLQGPSLFIHLDPRKTEVVVPIYFKKQPQLVLQVGMNMAIAIPDLKVDDEGVSCTLSFNRRPFWCRLPWTAIYALVGEDMKGMIWPDEVPSEVAAQRDGKAPQQAGARGRPAREARKKLGSLRSAPDEAKVAVRNDAEDDDVALPSVDDALEKAAELASAPGHSPPPAAAPDATREIGKSGKRELPPYLRVVK